MVASKAASAANQRLGPAARQKAMMSSGLMGSASVALEILDLAFVLLSRRPAVEGAQVAAFAGLWVLLARIKPVLAGRQFADHGIFLSWPFLSFP
jgi:hypothetical protein